MNWNHCVQLFFLLFLPKLKKLNVRRIPNINSRTVYIETFIRTELDLSVCSQFGIWPTVCLLNDGISRARVPECECLYWREKQATFLTKSWRQLHLKLQKPSIQCDSFWGQMLLKVTFRISSKKNLPWFAYILAAKLCITWCACGWHVRSSVDTNKHTHPNASFRWFWRKRGFPMNHSTASTRSSTIQWTNNMTPRVQIQLQLKHMCVYCLAV